jgi:serine/threonine-protein kinase/endoribonuclease IRE1
VIADLGLSKELKEYRKTFSQSTSRGTRGWMAPEILKEISNPKGTENYKTTLKVDVFCSGILIYYVKTLGKHPFGDVWLREGNITLNKYDFIDFEKTRDSIYANLIEKMISPDPDKRPSIQTVLSHPIFWDNEKILTFFMRVSDYLTAEKGASGIRAGIEQDCRGVFSSSDWVSEMDTVICSDLKTKTSKRPKYDGNKVESILRAIRNYAHHYPEKSPEVKAAFGSLNDEYLSYWTSKFPSLLLHTFKAIEPWKNRVDFQTFYDDSYNFS